MPTFKFDDEHGGTVEVSVKTTHHDGGEASPPDAAPPVNEWRGVVDMLNAQVVIDLAQTLSIDATTLPELRSCLRAWQRAAEVANLHAATHASRQLAQLWEALGRGEGTRGDWGAALAAVRVLVSHAYGAAQVPDHCWTKLEYELQRISKASEDELEAIGRVLGRARANIGRPPSYIETVDEYRAELTRLTKVKHS